MTRRKPAYTGDTRELENDLRKAAAAATRRLKCALQQCSGLMSMPLVDAIALEEVVPRIHPEWKTSIPPTTLPSGRQIGTAPSTLINSGGLPVGFFSIIITGTKDPCSGSLDGRVLIGLVPSTEPPLWCAIISQRDCKTGVWSSGMCSGTSENTWCTHQLPAGVPRVHPGWVTELIEHVRGGLP